MKPLDPRLLRYAHSARVVLAIGGLLGALRTLAIIAWCWCLAQALTTLVLPVLGGMGGAAGRVSEGAYPASSLPALLAGATAAVLVRSLASWGMDVVAARGAVQVKAQLRTAALDALDTRSPLALGVTSDATGSTTLGRGLDALDGYFSAYLPQLLLTVIATPLLVLTVLLADPVSGVTVIIVFPVIPLFMVLIGMATRAVQQRQWQQLQHLSRSFLDVVEGLTTLKIFGREQRQVARIARETGEYRRRTMQVLRVTFLSGFVLDLAGTFSIALVAVTVGTRLVAGEFPLGLGLFVLLLLPETFMPIRAVGAAYHSSTEGLAAAGEVFAVIDGPEQASTAPAAARSHHTAPEGDTEVVRFDDVELSYDGETSIGPISFDVRRGEVVALAGPSGAGKSTLVAALMGFVTPRSGALTRPAELAWAGQRPGLLQGTLAENVALGDDLPDPQLIRRALDAVNLSDCDEHTALGPLGAGLSGGQAQRVAIARALYRAWRRDAPVLVLDEPSSALDTDNERRLSQALRDEAAKGRAVLVVSHREALIDAADRVVRIGATS